MKRPSVSLCMIVKNEEKHLPRLFKTIEGCFDEIHITDTGSVDHTVDIAMDLGAVVHKFEWVNDFSKARNYSFSHAKSDYIMWLDADDSLMDAQKFIDFRDNVMSTADYWMARYDYTSDPVTGKSMCSFARERVVRRDKGMIWKYPIHEGILPVTGMESVKASYIPTWHVKHVRTAEDLEKDRSRNISLFESMNGNLDPRMQYYYGKELFEVGKPVEAAGQLLQAASSKNLEFHDRILAIQYACYAFMACNQYERVIDLTHQGLALVPNRAEFYCLLGDAYIKLGKLVEAIPVFSAAKACILPNQNAATAIFSHEMSYSTYPRNQLARVYSNLGDIDRGYLETKECIDKYNSEEAKILQSEIAKLKVSMTSFKGAKNCEDIVITCPPAGAYKWDPLLAKSSHMGGSETAAMEMAQWLKQHSGRSVKVFNNREDDVTIGGVDYISSKKIAAYMAENKPWMHVAWRHNSKITDAPTFVWCHDIYTPGMEAMDHYKKILALSPFHKKYLVSAFGMPADKVHVTANGIKPERFASDPHKKNSNKVIFSSSPDRGLDRVMYVLDRVRTVHPAIELHVFYGLDQLLKFGRQKEYDTLKAMMSERPWVKYHGGVSQEVLMSHQQDAAIWLYPTNFIETSCITAMEMVGNGVYPIVRAIGALVDTLAEAHENGMATIVESDCASIGEQEIYANEVIKAISEKKWEHVKLDMSKYSWENVAKQWLRELPELF